MKNHKFYSFLFVLMLVIIASTTLYQWHSIGGDLKEQAFPVIFVYTMIAFIFFSTMKDFKAENQRIQKDLDLSRNFADALNKELNKEREKKNAEMLNKFKNSEPPTVKKARAKRTPVIVTPQKTEPEVIDTDKETEQQIKEESEDGN